MNIQITPSSKRKKSVAFRAVAADTIEVRVPVRMSRRTIEAMIERMRPRLVRLLESYGAQHTRCWPNDEGVLFGGGTVPLVRVKGHRVVFENGQLCVGESVADLPRAVVKWMKTEAERLVAERLEWYRLQTGLTPTHWGLSNARGRWGSCSIHGAIRFNWRIAMMPLFVADYLIVHELAHLKHLHHQPTFWRLVAELCPDYQEAEAWIKREGAAVMESFR